MRIVPGVVLCAILWHGGMPQIYVNSEPPPPSIEALGRAADVIAIGTIEEVTDVERPAGGGNTSPWMECRLAISRLVKRDDRLSPLDTFVAFHVIGSHDSYQIDFRPFQTGEVLLVYLRWSTGMTGYVLAYGPDAAYEIVNGVVRSLGRSPVAHQHDGAALSRVLAALVPHGAVHAMPVARPDLSQELRRLASGAPGTLGVGVVHVETGTAASVNGDDCFPMMSVYKLPIAIHTLRQFELGVWTSQKQSPWGPTIDGPDSPRLPGRSRRRGHRTSRCEICSRRSSAPVITPRPTDCYERQADHRPWP